MGSCVSVHKASGTAIKHPLAPLDDKLSIPSPVQKPDAIDGGDRTVAQLALGSYRSPSSLNGMRDEIFFDSQPWLESDCEDDFLSVNGDFSVSGGSTPVHHSFSSSKPSVVSQASVTGGALYFAPSASPREDMSNKRLSELFKESSGHNHPYADENAVPEKAKVEVQPKHGNWTPLSSGASSNERTPNRLIRGYEQKPLKSVQCCIPRLIPTRSFSERGKKTNLTRNIEQ